MKNLKKILFHINKEAVIRQSTLFDAEWYQNMYGVSKKQAARHYLREGYLQGNNPSVFFSGADYVEANPDVKINPLLHYETWGKQEGRKLRANLPAASSTNSPQSGLFKFIYEKDAKQKCVKRCAVFAYYNDEGRIPAYVEYYLSELKKEVDFIVFVADNDLFSTAEFSGIKPYVDYAQFERHQSYDFGSYKKGLEYLKSNGLLDEIEELYIANDSCYGPISGFHDIFSRMREEKADFWGLVDSTDFQHHIQSFFYCFRQPVISDPYFFDFFARIVPPVTFDYAVSHFERQLTEYLKKKYTCKALLPSFADNALGVCAGNRNSTVWPLEILKAGFPFVKVKCLDGRFGYDLHGNRDELLDYIKTNNFTLYSLILQDLENRNYLNSDGNSNFFEDSDPCSVISFDIFDTLLIRPFGHPTMLFDYIEHKYELEGFIQARVNAERMARLESDSSEVTFEDIYRFMPPHLQDTAELELEAEFDLCRPNPKIRNYYEKAVRSGKTVIAISDMYLSSAVLKKLLEKNGFGEIVRVYSSSDYKKNKGSGELFELVLEKEQCRASELFHIGDNRISDFEVPKKTGIRVSYQEALLDYFLNLPSNAKYRGFYGQLPTLHASAHLMLLARHAFDPKLSQYSNYFEQGYSFGGPFALGFLNFICREAEKNGIDRLFFAARDGYILKSAYQEFFHDRVGIDAEYVFLNRAVVLGAKGECDVYPPYLKTLLEICHKEDPSIRAYDNTHDNQQEYKAKEEQIREIVSRNRENLTKHLIGKAGKSENIAVVDITTSKMTSLAGAKDILGDRVKMGLFSFIFYNTDASFPYAVFSDRWMTGDDDRALQLCEKIISSPENGIMKLDNFGLPIYQESTNPEREYQYSEIEKGVLQYIRDYRALFGSYDYPVMLASTWLILAENYLSHGTTLDNEILESLDYTATPLTE